MAETIIDNFDVDSARNHIVVKNNILIQDAKYHLSLQEQKILLFLISKIKPNDEELKVYKFKITEFCKVCGINSRSGKTYANIKDNIKKLYDKSVWVKLENEKETPLRWLENVVLDKNSGTIEMLLSKDMKPYLLNQKNKFTQYGYIYTINFKSQYSVRLYELFKSKEFMTSFEITIEKLKDLLTAQNYKAFNNLKRKILDVVMEDINDNTDIEVSYVIKKEGRKFHSLVFTIKKNKFFDERKEKWAELERILNQEDMEDLEAEEVHFEEVGDDVQVEGEIINFNEFSDFGSFVKKRKEEIKKEREMATEVEI
ncbi:MAG: replication initiation protein [Eubacteriaceae bacterium]